MSRLFSRTTLIILILIGVVVFSRLVFPAPLPTVILAPEQVAGLNLLGILPITNTLLATLLADVTIFIICFLAVRNLSLVPSGLQNVMEAITELFLNQAQDVVGAVTARKMIPIAMTAFMLILVANWWGRIPGFEAIGLIEEPHVGGLQTWHTAQVLPGLYTLTAQPGHVSEDHHAEAGKPAEEHHGVPEEAILVPFLRGATTDLNFPLALALIAFFYIQYWGFKANGVGYLKKFFNFTGIIPAFVGILEFISEFAKIISFSFRLFGNIFAGTVLVFVMSFLLPWFVPVPFALLEVFVGLVQAAVFALLVIIFAGGAMESHDSHADDHVATHADEAAEAAGHAVAHG